MKKEPGAEIALYMPPYQVCDINNLFNHNFLLLQYKDDTSFWKCKFPIFALITEFGLRATSQLGSQVLMATHFTFLLLF